MNILILGASSSIGQAITKQLSIDNNLFLLTSNKVKVEKYINNTLLNKNKIKIIEADLSNKINPELVIDYNINIFINAACATSNLRNYEINPSLLESHILVDLENPLILVKNKNLVFHSYFFYSRKDNQNYYFGLFKQFIRTKNIDVATAIGIRAYSKNSIKHLFFPQLLYTLHLTNNIRLGGSFVNILSQEKLSFEGTSIDVFLMYKVYENKKIKIDLSLGGFKPVTWTPYSGDWYPTYSVDIKIKN